MAGRRDQVLSVRTAQAFGPRPRLQAPGFRSMRSSSISCPASSAVVLGPQRLPDDPRPAPAAKAALAVMGRDVAARLVPEVSQCARLDHCGDLGRLAGAALASRAMADAAVAQEHIRLIADAPARTAASCGCRPVFHGSSLPDKPAAVTVPLSGALCPQTPDPLCPAVRISKDGKGRYLDKTFIERLWRTLKHECVCLHAWETGSQARAGVGRWVEFHIRRRPHEALGGRPPAVVRPVRNEVTQPDQQDQRAAEKAPDPVQKMGSTSGLSLSDGPLVATERIENRDKTIERN